MLMICYSLYLIHNLVLLRSHLLDCYYIEKSNRMDYVSIHRQAASMRKGLFDQGYLDEQFYQLEDLQDDASPDFVEEVVTLFFRDSLRLMANIDQSLDKCAKDFNKLDVYMQQLKGSCTSIGASKMKTECTVFRDYCRDENIEGCMRSFQKLKREHSVLRQKLESYFQLLRQAGPIECATRPSK